MADIKWLESNQLQVLASLLKRNLKRIGKGTRGKEESVKNCFYY